MEISAECRLPSQNQVSRLFHCIFAVLAIFKSQQVTNNSQIHIIHSGNFCAKGFANKMIAIAIAIAITGQSQPPAPTTNAPFSRPHEHEHVSATPHACIYCRTLIVLNFLRRDRFKKRDTSRQRSLSFLTPTTKHRDILYILMLLLVDRLESSLQTTKSVVIDAVMQYRQRLLPVKYSRGLSLSFRIFSEGCNKKTIPRTPLFGNPRPPPPPLLGDATYSFGVKPCIFLLFS